MVVPLPSPTWPRLAPYAETRPTYATLHRWTQIVGKIRLVHMPWVNHSWHVTLYVTPYGLTTRTVPAAARDFQIDLDFHYNELRISTSTGHDRSFSLLKLSVADFYAAVLSTLAGCGIECRIDPVPNELIDPIPLDRDETHRTYDPFYACDLHRAWLRIDRVFTHFRSGFLGKCSPVHLFWGGFDLAVTRFSGRKAPPHPGGVPNLPDWVAREAYSHEVCSCGFWPGDEQSLPEPAFYCYIYPEPEGFSSAPVEPAAAYYHAELGEFILPYTAVHQAKEPATLLLHFLNSTYHHAARLAGWDVETLDFEQPPER